MSDIPENDQDWRQRLTPEQYRVCREKGTEPPFSGALYHNKEPGVYRCVGCGAELFGSDTKFESGSGWPSFYAPLAGAPVAEERDHSFGMVRTEVHCQRCGSHLGHVFEDGPAPTGLRYCINSVSLAFEPADKGQSGK